MIWLRIIAALSAAACMAASPFILKKIRYTVYIAFLGIVLNGVVVISNWAINGYVPFISITQVLAFVGVCFPLTYLYIRFVRKNDISFGWFTLCEGVCLVGCAITGGTAVWQRAPALQSIFFLPHILCYMLSYALCAVAFVQTIITLYYAVKVAKSTKNDKDEFLDRQKTAEKTAYTLSITGFPFMVLGMFLGSVWANECWGVYWGWDPKETWALVTMCLYALYFHIRKHKFFDKWIIPVLILAFLSLVMTFVGINLFGLNALHSYS